MKSADLLNWFDALSRVKLENVISRFGLNAEGAKWVTDVASALAAAFPPGHEIRRRWEAASALEGKKDSKHGIELERLEAYRGIFASAHEQLREGRLESFIDSVRAQTEDDLLDQAEALLNENLVVAATVIAGGALEVHLRRLCAKNNLPIQGHGSIDKYNTAVAVARNAGVTVYEKPDSSSVTSWGQLRNDAAHSPDRFRATSDQVKLMIDGIRNFISRVR